MGNMKEMMDKSIEIFNTIDFEPYLRMCKTLDEFQDTLESIYNNTNITNNDFMKGHLFNVFTDSEIMDYLKERYGDKVSFYEYSYFAIDWED